MKEENNITYHRVVFIQKRRETVQYAFKPLFSEYCSASERLNVKASNVASSQTASQMSVLERVTQLIKAKDEVMSNIEPRSVAVPECGSEGLCRACRVKRSKGSRKNTQRCEKLC